MYADVGNGKRQLIQCVGFSLKLFEPRCASSVFIVTFSVSEASMYGTVYRL